MIIMGKGLIVSIFATMLLAVPAAAFQAQNRLWVDAAGEGRFVVQPSAGQSAPESWCAAGDYAIRVLGLAPATPIYRLSVPPRGKGGAVTFGLSPEGAAAASGVLRLNEVGAAFSAGAAQGLCNPGRGM